MKDASSIFRPYLARATVAMFALLGASAVVPSSALAAKTVYIDPARPESFAAASDAVADGIDVVIKGGTLVADMDLRGLNRKVTLDGDLDLAGHRIFVRAIDGSGTLTSSQTAFTDLTEGASRACGAAAPAFDDDRLSAASWSSFTNGAGVKIDYDFGTPTNVNRYTIYNRHSGNSSGRNQKNWVLYGSNDNSSWVELDRRENETFPHDAVRSFDFVNGNCYRCYRMQITHVVNANNPKLDVYEIEYGVASDQNGIFVDPSALGECDISSIKVLSGNGVGIGDLTLTEDLDLSSFGEYAILGTVDLNGHALRTASLCGTGMIADTSASSPGTLHVDAAADSNGGVSLTGNLKLVKTGAGTLTLTKGSRTYTGGTQIAGGDILRCTDGKAVSLSALDNPHALVIMLDGFRADLVTSGEAPNLRKLLDGKWQPGYRCAGTLAANATRRPHGKLITESAPNHIAIATGMTPVKTEITGNPSLVKIHEFRLYPTWLERLAKIRPETKPLHIFSWKGDLHLAPDPAVKFVYDRCANNAETLVREFSREDCSRAVMWYIGTPDHAGHGSCYYPYAGTYIEAVRESDRLVGKVLDAIAARPTFQEEDWLVIVTADHGGYENRHSMPSAQTWTIPLLVTSRHVAQGRIPGVPHNYDTAPTVLTHFGIDVSGIDFDGKAVRGDVAKGETGRLLDGCKEFSFALWACIDEEPDSGPAVIIGNKDWTDGAKAGFALASNVKCDGYLKPGVAFNAGRTKGAPVFDGLFSVEYGKWTFYAATLSADGVLTVYQGAPDGRLYSVADDAHGIEPANGQPIRFGQNGKIKNAAVWMRALERSEVERLFARNFLRPDDSATICQPDHDQSERKEQ